MTAKAAGNTPPTRATTIASTRYSSSTLVRPNVSRAPMKASVIAGSPSAAMSQPANCRRGGSGVSTRRIAGSRRASSSPLAGGEITWTSIGPDAARRD